MGNPDFDNQEEIRYIREIKKIRRNGIRKTRLFDFMFDVNKLSQELDKDSILVVKPHQMEATNPPLICLRF